MNIALLTEKYPPDPGGLAVSVARLARLLASAGHRVHVFAPSGALAPGEVASSAQATVYVERLGAHKRADDTLAAWSDALATAHARAPFDVLHAYFVTQAGFVAVYGGRVLGVPSVVSARGNDLDRAVFDPGKAAHTLYALQHAAAVTANSRDLQRKAQALATPFDLEAGRSDARVTARHRAVRTGRARPGAAPRRSAWGSAGDRLQGEAREKGLATLLLAARAVQRRRVALLLAAACAVARRGFAQGLPQQNPDLPVVVAAPQPPCRRSTT
jgi:glycosyltransferase involved in cell wall biosynthesis